MKRLLCSGVVLLVVRSAYATSAFLAAQSSAQTYAPSEDEENLALFGTASQSSTYVSVDGNGATPAERAIDGNTVGEGEVYLAHTNRENKPWWKVDLNSLVSIKKVVVWNRMDCCLERLSNSNVDILDNEGNVIATKSIGDASTSEKISLDFDNAVGSAVRIQLLGTTYLHLAEVQVFGKKIEKPSASPSSSSEPSALSSTSNAPSESSDPSTFSSIPLPQSSDEENLALLGTASQSSTYSLANTPAERAIDGKTSGWGEPTVSHTNGENKAWWKVDLNSFAIIRKVVIWNRLDCCTERMSFSNLDILDGQGNVVKTREIGNTLYVPEISFDFDNVIGSAVRIQLQFVNYLHLAEVQVFGEKVETPSTSPSASYEPSTSPSTLPSFVPSESYVPSVSPATSLVPSLSSIPSISSIPSLMPSSLPSSAPSLPPRVVKCEGNPEGKYYLDNGILRLFGSNRVASSWDLNYIFAKAIDCTGIPSGPEMGCAPGNWQETIITTADLDQFCNACEAGTFSDEEGIEKCKPCSPGTYQPFEGQLECRYCAPGTYRNTTRGESCVQCAPGTYQPLKGQTQCEECRAGGYCDASNTSVCDGGFTACPVGTYNKASGKYNVTSCVPCPEGTFSDNKSGLESCFKCPEGTYQNNESQPNCKVCNDGTIQNKTGQSSCDMCLPGTYPDQSRSSCLDCPKGTYSSESQITCNQCDEGTVQSQTGKSSCEVCPSGTYSDQSRVTCIECPYSLGSNEKSGQCPFCADDFYLKVAHYINPQILLEDRANLCLPCPSNGLCYKNTTIETIVGEPGFWRDSLQTETFYKCNDKAGICLGGTSCILGHSGVQCEVCVNEKEYFDSTTGGCTSCPSYSRIGIIAGILIGIVLFLLLIAKYIVQRYKQMKHFITTFSSTLTAIGMQAKFKIVISFYQVVVTFKPIYGVRMHSAFTWWFSIFEIFDFGLAETFLIPERCFGSMQARLLIGAGWPYMLALALISVIFFHFIIINVRRRKRKDALAKLFSLSLYTVIGILYLVLPSISRHIFDARTCKSFKSNDSENKLSSYLIADFSIKCAMDDSNYRTISQAFWVLFALWPIAVPVGFLLLLLLIRPSVQSNTTTKLAEGSRFLWFDYTEDMMFWEVIDLARKISLTGLMIFIDTEEGSERILRLIVATGICIFYGTILSYARPYRREDDFKLAVLSNLLLTCFFLVGIIIHQCEEGGDTRENSCYTLFGFTDSYRATVLAVILTAVMLVAFVVFTLIQSVNELKAPIVRLVSTNNTPSLIMPEGCKYHLFVSHIWASGQCKVHKIVRMLKLYIQGVNIWLDVDVLENLSDLEKSVQESAHFILFYSQGYFASFNCRREVIEAMELKKPISIMCEPDENMSVDISIQMREEFDMFWPQDSTRPIVLNYIFVNNAITWISKGLQLSLESIKLVTFNLLKSLPYYIDKAALLDAGLKIDGEINPVEMLMPLDILYCSTNIGAEEIALKLVEECKGDVVTRAMDLSDGCLQVDRREAIMLVYLNNRVYQCPDCMLCDSIIRSIEDNIQVVLVHENDIRKGGCPFWQVIEQTPELLKIEPYSIYSNNIAVSLYSVEEYQKAGLRQILTKMGAKAIGSKGIIQYAKKASTAMIKKSKKSWSRKYGEE